MVSLRITDDAAQWDRLVADHPGSTAFHDWEWLDFQADLLTLRIERHLVVVDGEPVGVFPLPRRAGCRPPAPGELAALLPALLQEAYVAHSVHSPYPPDIGTRLEAFASDRPWVNAHVATVRDELAGALILLGRHPTAVGWVGGILRRFRTASANALLHQSCLEAATLGGHASVDFSGWVDDAIGSYKLGFGGDRPGGVSSDEPVSTGPELRPRNGHERGPQLGLSPAGQAVAIGASVAPQSRTRSAGASSTCRPRRPAETNTVSKRSAEASTTTGSRCFWPSGEMPPTT